MSDAAGAIGASSATPAADSTADTGDVSGVGAADQSKDQETPPPAQDDDPELELAKDFKMKRSEAASRLQKLKELERGAHDKFEQAANLRKTTNTQLENLAAALENDPAQVFKHFGKDFEAVLQREVARRVADAGMTPEQKAAQAEKQELAKLRAEQKQWEEQKQQQEMAQQQSQWEQRISDAFTPVIESAGLPKDWSTVARMARYSEWYLERGEEPPLQHIAARVKQDFLDEQMSILGQATPEQIEALVPQAIRDKWRQSELKKLQAANKQAPQRHEGQAAPNGRKMITQAEWNKRFTEL